MWLNMQVIELPIKHPELFESLGIAQPKVVSHFAVVAKFYVIQSTNFGC